MKISALPSLLLLWVICFFSACANVLPPTGGDKDVKPPVLVSITPKDSLLNTRVRKIEMRFDEYVHLADNGKDIQISPLLAQPMTIKSKLKTVTIEIPDTLLTDNTTYKISFNREIQDLHENNPFAKYQYTFSTGAYFDSLMLQGSVINAETGQADTGVNVMLFNVKDGDSAILYKKPSYITRVDGKGNFAFTGLPGRDFYIFALRETNNNMVFDKDEEFVAFLNNRVTPIVDSGAIIMLRTFQEEFPKDSADEQKLIRRPPSAEKADAPFTYNVNADTTDLRKRTFDVTKVLTVEFTKHIHTQNTDKVFLSYENNGTLIEAITKVYVDSMAPNVLNISAKWKLNTVYTLRLLKGFVKDSSGNDAMPSKTSFRTKSEDDYSKMKIHLPTRFYGNQFLLQVRDDRDTIYQRPVQDTIVTFSFLQPGKYSFKVIADNNRNGKWDPGNVKQKLQPEYVYPYKTEIQLKAAWDNIFDFDEVEKKPAPPVKKAGVSVVSPVIVPAKDSTIKDSTIVVPKVMVPKKKAAVKKKTNTGKAATKKKSAAGTK